MVILKHVLIKYILSGWSMEIPGISVNLATTSMYKVAMWLIYQRPLHDNSFMF